MHCISPWMGCLTETLSFWLPLDLLSFLFPRFNLFCSSSNLELTSDSLAFYNEKTRQKTPSIAHQWMPQIHTNKIHKTSTSDYQQDWWHPQGRTLPKYSILPSDFPTTPQTNSNHKSYHSCTVYQFTWNCMQRTNNGGVVIIMRHVHCHTQMSIYMHEHHIRDICTWITIIDHCSDDFQGKPQSVLYCRFVNSN